MHLSTAAGFPPLPTEEAVIAVVQHAMRRRLRAHVAEWHVRRDNYLVAAVECESLSTRLIVKLELPGDRPNRHLDVMASIGRIVRAQTSAPTFDVVAVDVSRREWPWEYLIVTEVPGVTWQTLYPTVSGPARAAALRQIGRSAAAVHTLRFDSFGELDPTGCVRDGTSAVAALKLRALRRIKTPRFQDVMLGVLDTRAELFQDVTVPTLCHEDMNPNNLVFERCDGVESTDVWGIEIGR